MASVMYGSVKGIINHGIFDIQLLQFIVILFGLFNYSLCLYEDQVGKFDWRHNYVGRIKFASFDTVSTTKKIIVVTEENVFSALHLKSGQLLWRRVFEKEGKIHALSDVSDGGDLITVSGSVPVLVRIWDPATGHILNEWPLAEQNPERLKDVKWHLKDGILYHILPLYSSGVQIISYDSKTGEKLKNQSVSAPFLTPETECVFTSPSYLTCLKGDQSLAILFIVDLFNEEARPQSITSNNIFGAGAQGPFHIEVIPGKKEAISITSKGDNRKRIIIPSNESNILPRDIDGNTKLYLTTIDNKLVLFEITYENKVTELKAFELSTSSLPPLQEYSSKITHDGLFYPTIMASTCYSSQRSNNQGVICQYLLSSEDHSFALLHNNKLIWSREEALANIITVEMVELPMSDRDQTIETEFDTKDRNILGMIMRRLTAQFNQIKSFVQSAFDMNNQQSNQRVDLVRDKFGLYKMIVAVTSAGKIFGIESKKGEIIWQSRIIDNNSLTINPPKSILLYIQRGSRHFPHSPQCLLLATDKTTGEGMIYTFNPITGQPLLDGLVKLGYKLKQSMLLQTTTDDFLRPVLLLDSKDKIHVYPENATTVVVTDSSSITSKNTYLFTGDKETGVLSGYSLGYSTKEELIVNKVWEFTLSPKNQKITHIVSKNPLEHVHSQGRVLGDRSVLYKYINPNLVAIISQGVGNIHKNTLNLYLLDVVSGGIVYSIVHKRVRGPFHIVHSENWVVYSYFNDKSRRTEIATLELYEGKVQSNTTVFSSLTTTQLPLVERQAFIFPASIEAIQETITEKGITSKHILVSLANGGILELPWMLLDPRRPINPELREEGVIPYTPEIPIQMDAIINYNQSVFRVSGIYTSPSGLESTCLVFVHGLDIFYTRVAPSKTFDVLKEDFDYYLIVIVLTALMIASYITKKLASQKAQKQAWK
ncbi:ER membrane protein complex subunit 1 isoform X2 [Chelonus insularis]|uniref:ER membrane protein complex subunit 1 isoform X2 n=1 Tax=Chelonus insularis TaxID=460826 RepID=UPI00158C8F51|nr:ER membrane protein complex subunit 1 isoform X2 [Chelonus insularis]